ncbi:MAG: beta-L-arabinofuranosidase domain-containing protein [Bryobacteraceae bacterium]
MAVLEKRLRTYARGGTVKVKPAFVSLPPGAVTPGGWLKDWAEDAANGITGHLDEYSATFAEAWKGYGFRARGANPDGTGWPLEQSSYWLDGAVRLAYVLNDQTLIAKVSRRLDLVVEGVLDGGESFVYWRPLSVLQSTFNTWAHSHMGRALVAYYQATGQPRVLEALVKVYRTYPIGALRSAFDDVSGATNVDPMIETYLMSGDRRVLENVLAFARTDRYRAIAAAWRQGDLQPGHNVIFYEHLRIPALLSPWTGDPNDLAATLKAIGWHDEHHLLPIGLSSGEEFHAGIGATRNSETCNVAASIWTWLWLSRITGQGSYSDRVERVFFNAAPAAVARDFKTMSYYQCPNRYSTSIPAEEPRNPSGGGSYKFTRIGHETLCCVGNLNRVLPFYIGHMWMATLDGGLAATLYGPSRVRAVAGNNVRVEIEARTAYPFQESVELTVAPERTARFPLYVRIPAWCHTPEVRINGAVHPLDGAAKGYIRIGRRWKKGDTVTVRLPMRVIVARGRETSFPRIDYFRRGRRIAWEPDTRNPYACVFFGPLLFSLGIRDEDPNQEAAGEQFNYALDVKPGSNPDGTWVERGPMPGRWNWPLEAPVRLSIQAKEFDWQPTDVRPLPGEPVAWGRAARIVLVPYGCTKFRVSMFPVTKEAWGH